MQTILVGSKNIEVDDDIFELLKQYKLYRNPVTDYVYLYNGVYNIRGKFPYLHRWIMNAPKGIIVDHIDSNDKDNYQRSNLRFATSGQNKQNSSVIKSSSGYKGVSWIKRDLVFYACICHNYKEIGLYRSTSADECAYAYNFAATYLKKEFAYLNKIEKEIPEGIKKHIEQQVTEKLSKYVNK